jgi:hypothetical protein
MSSVVRHRPERASSKARSREEMLGVTIVVSLGSAPSR